MSVKTSILLGILGGAATWALSTVTFLAAIILGTIIVFAVIIPVAYQEHIKPMLDS